MSGCSEIQALGDGVERRRDRLAQGDALLRTLAVLETAAADQQHHALLPVDETGIQRRFETRQLRCGGGRRDIAVISMSCGRFARHP